MEPEKQKRVLYAEDEFTNRKLLEIGLKREGVLCDLALNGQEALDLFHQKSYDLVILDHYMPVMSGKEAAIAIRKIDSNVPILAITSDDEEIPTLKAAGCNEILIKPLHGPGYMKRIMNYLEESC
jgi:CheY-like chemotaxis protein